MKKAALACPSPKLRPGRQVVDLSPLIRREWLPRRGADVVLARDSRWPEAAGRPRRNYRRSQEHGESPRESDTLWTKDNAETDVAIDQSAGLVEKTHA
jgi:hypothetical protein